MPEEGRKNIADAEIAGIGFHSCSYLKLFVGEVVRDKIGITDGTIKEGYPRPDLIWTTHLCNLHSKWYLNLARNRPEKHIELSKPFHYFVSQG